MHWVDTTGDFSAERASDVLEAAARARPLSSNGPCNSVSAFQHSPSELGFPYIPWIATRSFQPDLNQSQHRVKLLERLHVSLSLKAGSAYAGITEALAASRSDSVCGV